MEIIPTNNRTCPEVEDVKKEKSKIARNIGNEGERAVEASTQQ